MRVGPRALVIHLTPPRFYDLVTRRRHRDHPCSCVFVETSACVVSTGCVTLRLISQHAQRRQHAGHRQLARVGSDMTRLRAQTSCRSGRMNAQRTANVDHRILGPITSPLVDAPAPCHAVEHHVGADAARVGARTACPTRYRIRTAHVLRRELPICLVVVAHHRGSSRRNHIPQCRSKRI